MTSGIIITIVRQWASESELRCNSITESCETLHKLVKTRLRFILLISKMGIIPCKNIQNNIDKVRRERCLARSRCLIFTYRYYFHWNY